MTHEEAMQDDFGVPNHVKLDGQPSSTPQSVDKEAIKGWLINYCDGKFPGDFTVNEVVSILESYSSNLLKENEELKAEMSARNGYYENKIEKLNGCYSEKFNEANKAEKEVEYWKARCVAAEAAYNSAKDWWEKELSLEGYEKLSDDYDKWQALKQQPIK